MTQDEMHLNEAPGVSHYMTLYNEIRALRSALHLEQQLRQDAEAKFKNADAARSHAEGLLRETHVAMIKHQQLGKMGDFRFNAVTGESRGSSVSYQMTGQNPGAEWVEFDSWANVLHPDDRPRILKELFEAVQERAPLRFEYRMVVDGQIKHIKCDGQPDDDHDGDLTYYGVLTDITERKAFDDALRRAEAELATALRLASMGELAGSIIHEINQPLAAIGASAEACRRWIATGPQSLNRALASLDRVIEESARAAAVVAGLKSLVRETTPAIASLDAAATLRDVSSLILAELARERILLHTDAATDIPFAQGDVVQVQQVLMNLIRNAIEAMQNSDSRRRLTLSASRVGAMVVLKVADTGPGIDAATAERLFEPLFTTKPGGMGLGLAISRRIVIAHGGKLWIENVGRPGGVFCFSLPLATG